MNIEARLDMIHDASMLSCLGLRGIDADGTTPGPPRQVERGEWSAMNTTQFPDIELLAERGTRASVEEEGAEAGGYPLSNGEVVDDADEQSTAFCLEQVSTVSHWRALKDLFDEVIAPWGQVMEEVDAHPDLEPARSAYRDCVADVGLPAEDARTDGPLDAELLGYFQWVNAQATVAASVDDADLVSARYGSLWATCAEDLMAQVYERRAGARQAVLDDHREQIERFARGVFVDVLEAPGAEGVEAQPDTGAPLWDQDLSEVPDDELQSLLRVEAAERAGLTEEDFQTQDWVNLPEVQAEYEALVDEVEETGTISPC